MKPEHFITNYENALTSQKWEAVDPLIHPNCTVTFSNGRSHRGKNEVQAAYQTNFALIKSEKHTISEIHRVVKAENFAIYTFAYEWSGMINGELASGSGRGTSTLIGEDATWRLIPEHLGPKS